MSHSLGAIRFNDNTIRYYEYNGTSDIIISKHYANSKEVSDNWRKHFENECKCKGEEVVMIYTSYGSGYYIEGFACKKCKSVRPKEFDFDIIEFDETEDWAIKLFEFKNDSRK